MSLLGILTLAKEGHPKAIQTLVLAKRGNPGAIGFLINEETTPQGIHTHAEQRDGCLCVLLEANPLPEPQHAIALVQNSLKALKIELTQPIVICGYQQGEWIPTWQHTMRFEPSSSPRPSSTITVTYTPSTQFSDASFSDASFSDVSAMEISSVNISPVDPEVTGDRPSSTEQLIPSTELAAPSEPPSELSSETLSEPSSELSSETLSFTELATPSEFSSLELPSELPPPSETPDVFKRPETVIFLIFIGLFVFWDTYATLLEEAESSSKRSLTTGQLARRLKTSKSMIRRKKRLNGFSEWTQRLDPDGVAWVYHRGVYLPHSAG
ncbi:MAG: hypothetical protein HC769_16080 [Cyanobacteria bacterium CRU_2_1]|nr:hypothetical protein [Cyanobacteria bacterium RU_5_0]NJR60215.1 hypothetical protein [Cyanobacteria bacterium CRU_2_1]